jgi:hypothetical protein
MRWSRLSLLISCGNTLRFLKILVSFDETGFGAGAIGFDGFVAATLTKTQAARNNTRFAFLLFDFIISVVFSG